MLATSVRISYLPHFSARKSHRFTIISFITGNTGDAMKLIERGADVFFVDPRDGWAGAHYAARFGKIRVLDAMIKAGVDVNMRTTGRRPTLVC